MNNFDFNVDFGGFSFGENNSTEKFFDLPSNFVKKELKPISENYIKYENAENLSKDIDFPLNQGERFHVLVSGSFIFGDFIEAFIVEKNIKVKEMTISTLSLSEDNIDSLQNLIVGGYIDKLNILISHYFFSHERHKLIPILYKRLSLDGFDLQIAFAGVHTKCVLIETINSNKIVITGSANLRSSGNIEFFNLENDGFLYEFHYLWHKEIINKYKTLKKIKRGKELWQLIGQTGQTNKKQHSECQQQRQKEHQNLKRLQINSNQKTV